MVHARAGFLGAVSRGARNPSKTSNTTKKKTKKPKVSKADKKNKKKKNQKVETAEEQRARHELYLLTKQMEAGVSLEKIDYTKLDRKLDKMQHDEESGEESSDDEEPITNQKMLKKYQVDREDYMLQYANAEEKPMYFEEYQPTMYKCFFELERTKWECPASETFNRLVKYTNQIMESYAPPTFDKLPAMLISSPLFRQTSEYTNFCFNPIQAMRAWGLLHNIAQNKTAHELRVFIDTYTTNVPTPVYSKKQKEKKKEKEKENEPSPRKIMNISLLALHYDAERLFDGCVRLFTELPRHLPYDVNMRRKSCVFYGGKSQRAAIQHHCFATDPDGFYSCYRINEEVARSTHGAVRYVIPEEHAPNWRSSIALVSAMDCTFYWKVNGEPTILHNYKFDGGNGIVSKCTVISGKASLLKDEQHRRYRLQSQIPGVALVILVEDPSKVNDPKSLPLNLYEIIKESRSWAAGADQQVYLPKCTTSVPFSLYDHSKHNGLSRLFCSEKSELRQLKITNFEDSGAPQYVTLFDHYHKTVFEICAAKRDDSKLKRRFDELAPARAHQCIDESRAKFYGEYQNYSPKTSKDLIFTYYEDHLDRNHNSLECVYDEKELKCAEDNTIDLGKPFYYVMTRQFGDEEMIVCAGYFNNTVFVKPSE